MLQNQYTIQMPLKPIYTTKHTTVESYHQAHAFQDIRHLPRCRSEMPHRVRRINKVGCAERLDHAPSTELPSPRAPKEEPKERGGEINHI